MFLLSLSLLNLGLEGKDAVFAHVFTGFALFLGFLEPEAWFSLRFQRYLIHKQVVCYVLAWCGVVRFGLVNSVLVWAA